MGRYRGGKKMRKRKQKGGENISSKETEAKEEG